MSIHTLMANPAARDAYLTIPANSSPLALADQYASEKLAGNTDTCIAIEEHLRDLARVHFHKPFVLEALKMMETYKAARKPGKSGSSELKRIARTIEENYASGNFTIRGDKVFFQIDNLAVSCLDMPGAVAWLAAKYRKGLPRRNWKQS